MVQTAASQQTLEASTESAARIPGFFEEMICEEASHQSTGEGNKEELEVEMEECSSPGVRESEPGRGGTEETKDVLPQEMGTYD